MINKDRKSKKQFRKQKENDKNNNRKKNHQDKLPLLKDNWNIPDL